MHGLYIDIETYSGIDLQESGVYKYVESPDFDILLFGYSMDGDDVKVIDLASGEKLSDELITALLDTRIIKYAHNASFERVCLSQYLKNKGIDIKATYLDPAGWRCSMVLSAYLGLPLSLKDAGSLLNLPEQKLSEGKGLIRLFCIPQCETDSEDLTTRHYPEQYPEEWNLFREYNKRDVEVEIQLVQRLSVFNIPDSLWEDYCMDQKINDLGISLDISMVEHAINMDALTKDEIISTLKKITGLENPRSISQLKKWLAEQGIITATLDKKAVESLLRKSPPDIQQVLRLFQQVSKSSVAKYNAMRNVICADGRAHGMFQFYGTHTGRWAGRLIQLQNLPKNSLPDPDSARDLICHGNSECLRLLYGNIPDVLSQTIRTAFIPETGFRFIIADYSAIEARVLAWLAREKWRQEVFAANGDIYCASATQMFRVNVEKHGENSHLRQKGKIAELALGYGGSVGALKAMGALDMGLEESSLQDLVNAWRRANPCIVMLWHKIDDAALDAIRTHGCTYAYGLSFYYKKGILFIRLPSGRSLSYVNPRIGTNRFGGACMIYDGVSSSRKWEAIETYGPKLVENIVQAISRDILCFAMHNLDNTRIVMHIHDELVIEAERNVTVEEICSRMDVTPPWAEGLILHSEGFSSDYYKKD